MSAFQGIFEGTAAGFHWILALDGMSHQNSSSENAGGSVVLSRRMISPCLGSSENQQFAGFSIVSVADGVAQACVDDDSVETDTALVHVYLDGMVTSVCLGPDGMINSISQISSSYTDCQPVLLKNHFCLSMGEGSMACMV